MLTGFRREGQGPRDRPEREGKGPSGPSEREGKGPSGPSEREGKGPSGPSEREAQGPSGPSEREAQRDPEELESTDVVLATAGTRSARWWRAGVVAVLVFGVAARFVALSHLWLDEALSVNIARLPLDELDEALRHDGAPPLYYVLLHGWTSLFGTSEFAVRALSGLFAVAALPLMWLAGCRMAGRRVGWVALLLLASSPFAVRYATEARMYSLVALLVLVGYLALDDLLHRFSWPAAALLAVTTGLLLLTHYWAFFLLVVVAAIVWRRAVRGPRPDEARRALWTMAAGTLLFLPWLPSFLYQMTHTGTPWAGRAGLGGVLDVVTRFAGGPWDPGFVLSLIFYLLMALALFGRAVDNRHVDLDLRTRPDARPLTVAVFGTLVLAIVVTMISGDAFAVRYAAVVAPLMLLLVALGTRVFVDPRVFRWLVAIMVVLGFNALVPGLFGERTSAATVAAGIEAGASPGDVIAYCPDQLGPSVSRLLPDGFDQLTFPAATSPELVDWVDYEARNRAGRTAPFAEMLLARAGPTHDIWLVWAPGYRTLGSKCSALIDRLEVARPDMTRVVKVKTRYFEHPGLVRFRPPPP